MLVLLSELPGAGNLDRMVDFSGTGLAIAWHKSAQVLSMPHGVGIGLSYVALTLFAVLLLGHARFGWRGRDAVRMVYVGAVLLLLAYAGSRFVLEVILGRGV